MTIVNCKVNRKSVQVEVEKTDRLIDMLRKRLQLTGTKEGCGVGECGACTVIMNGDTVCSCLVMATQCENANIQTIEGVETDGKLHQLQEEFIRTSGAQCGFCTPGMIMSAKALLDRNSTPTHEDILEALEGNICRCTGYTPILEAVQTVIDKNK